MQLRNPISVSEAARFLEINYAGKPETMITGINEIHKVKSGDLTFVDVPKYYQKALHSAATVILINSETEIPDGKALLISKDPFSDYNRMVHFFLPKEEPHPGLNRGENVIIGENCAIYPGVVMGRDISIGNNCTLFPNVVIYDNAI